MGTNPLVLLILLSVVCCASSKRKVIRESMFSRACSEKGKIFWVSEDTNAIVIGKRSDSNSVRKCELTFGLAASPKHEEARLRLEFDFLYIHDCGVELQVNESSDSMFSPALSNRQMLKSNCNEKIPRVLHAQPKNFVRVRLNRSSLSLVAYNFRLNISMTEKLPEVGLSFHTMVITGFVMVLLVCLCATIFFKYLAYVAQRWHERSVGNAMDRAMSLYNSQEPLPEQQDHVLVGPGHGGGPRQQARQRPREPEIAFIHRDGRIERFRPLGATTSSEQLGPQGSRGEADHAKPMPMKSRVHEPERVRSQLSTSTSETRVSGAVEPDTPAHHKSSKKRSRDLAETSSLGGAELPPTYEEALEMPIANGESSTSSVLTPDLPMVASGASGEAHRPNAGGEPDGAYPLDVAEYMNVNLEGRDRTRSPDENEEAALSESNSDAPLLPRGRDSSVGGGSAQHQSNLNDVLKQ